MSMYKEGDYRIVRMRFTDGKWIEVKVLEEGDA